MKRLKVTHYLQDPAYCAVAACAVATNYYNSKINYQVVKGIADKKISNKIGNEGLESPQICKLLNILGFQKVTYITSYLNLVDYKWIKFGRKKMIKEMEKSLKVKSNKNEKLITKMTLTWLKNFKYSNNIIISYDFGEYIRQHLDKKKPVILSFNWTMFQKFPKEGRFGEDPYNGQEEEHAVVANGYDNKGVWLVDSHHQYYKYTRKKYRRGFYKISWENLMTCMGQGDVFLPEKFQLK